MPEVHEIKKVGNAVKSGASGGVSNASGKKGIDRNHDSI